MNSEQDSIQGNEERIAGLIQVWKVLEVLVVSLDRIGHYQRVHGEEAGKEALSQFFGPSLFQDIATARGLVVEILEKHDASIVEELEAYGDNENEIGYWNE